MKSKLGWYENCLRDLNGPSSTLLRELAIEDVAEYSNWELL